MVIDNVMINGMCNLSTVGFSYGLFSGPYSTYWVLPRYWDRLTLTNPSTPAFKTSKLEIRKSDTFENK